MLINLSKNYTDSISTLPNLVSCEMSTIFTTSLNFTVSGFLLDAKDKRLYYEVSIDPENRGAKGPD